MRTCVTPEQMFTYLIHKPSYTVRNLRRRSRIEKLGSGPDGRPVLNERNYPAADVEVEQADWIYEIANPFPFRGTTYIGKSWADRSAADPERIRIPEKPDVSLHRFFSEHGIEPPKIDALPRPLLLGLAVASTDPDDLIRLAKMSCRFEFDEQGRPAGLRYLDDQRLQAEIADFELFEATANNPHLPDAYKIAMVIRPGAQGESEITGDHHQAGATHIYEYLRRNSYIGGGHYAANMADDAVRYLISDLSADDIRGLRHLYYQRSFVRLADCLNIAIPRQPLPEDALETLRAQILGHPDFPDTGMAATLWGWNFGFDFSSSGYRLHASHQQIHQQYAMIPEAVESYRDGLPDAAGSCRSFSCGDMVEEVIDSYRAEHDRSFFHDYLEAVKNNRRLDGRDDLSSDLIVWQDDRVLLLVPKAQTSQWELQLLTKTDNSGRFPGNIVETDAAVRRSLDLGILKAQQALTGRGAAMVSVIEYSKRFASAHSDQPLIYCFLPKLPQSMGAFSEAQLRYINSHFPEDFARICRRSLAGKN